MAGINMPGQQPGQLEGLMKALNIASAVYGIRTESKRLDVLNKQMEDADALKPQQQQLADLDVKSKEANLAKTQAETANIGKLNPQDQKNKELLGQKLQSEINKNNAYAANLAKGPIDNIAKIKNESVKEQYKDLSKKNAGLFSVKAGMDSALLQLNDPNLNEEQKVKVGQGLLKLLNSAEGADAVGVEEAKRIGSFLEYKIGNFTQPGSFIGRDLDKFIDQVSTNSSVLGQRITLNEQAANELLQGKSLATNVAEKKETKKFNMNNLSPIQSAVAGQKGDKINKEADDLMKSLGIGL